MRCVVCLTMAGASGESGEAEAEDGGRRRVKPIRVDAWVDGERAPNREKEAPGCSGASGLAEVAVRSFAALSQVSCPPSPSPGLSSPFPAFFCESGYSPCSSQSLASAHRIQPGSVSPASVASMSGRVPKQSMSELKLRRLSEHNQRLREDLARPRIRVSEASKR